MIKTIYDKVVNIMKNSLVSLAMLYALNIVNGKRTFKDTPKFLKAKVAEQLIIMDAVELIDDPEFLPQETTEVAE